MPLPSVAVFDAVFLPAKREPILLLQPTPRLSDLSSASTADMDVPQVTFIGRIGDSLFALSHTNYPLVVFTPLGKKSLPRIDDGGKTAPEGSQSAERCLDLDCFVGTRLSEAAARSGLGRLLEDAHTLLIEGSAGVEDPPQVPFEGRDELATRSQSRSQPQPSKQVQTRTPQEPGTLDAPRPTRTTNTTSYSRPHVHVEAPGDKAVPEATPSHRTALRALASEWVAAWAGMGGVILSTIMFGLGLGARKGRMKVWRAFGAKFGSEVKEPSSVDAPSPVPEEKKEQEEDEEEDTPPPVPPKPYSLSKMAANPYLITDDSRPPPPPKEPAGKRVRSRKRPGLSGPASVLVLPTVNPAGNLHASASTGDINEEEKTEETEAEEVVQDTETVQDEKLETAVKKKVRRGGRGRRGKGKSKEEDVGSGGDGAEEGAPGIASALSEGSESFVKVERAAVAKSSLVVSEDVLGTYELF